MIIFLLIAVVAGSMNIDSLTASLHIETGMAFLEQGLPEAARSEFTSALGISPDAAMAYLGLARIAAQNYAWESAEEQYNRFMELQPNDYRGPLEMSEMLLPIRGRSDDALRYAEAALELAPTSAHSWLALADALACVGNTEEAKIWYTRVITEDSELAGTAREKMGAMLFRAGSLSEAREILLPAAEAGSDEAWHILALVYLEQNDALRAIDTINRYLFLCPNGSWADSARTCLLELSSAIQQ